ncbi:hypothetical protein [Bacillus sp. X1(2014)]|uniref:hypothetical protein n=1 Tax=Bacillus sp. X1(2014) TaxID=1565991 RepID=UPI0016430CBC|nr:hypothetical protein [Bacillus sp. X1(2014)]
MANFWRMNNPTYHSDRQEESINGYAEHPYGLPGVECTGCGKLGLPRRLSIMGCLRI